MESNTGTTECAHRDETAAEEKQKISSSEVSSSAESTTADTLTMLNHQSQTSSVSPKTYQTPQANSSKRQHPFTTPQAPRPVHRHFTVEQFSFSVPCTPLAGGQSDDDDSVDGFIQLPKPINLRNPSNLFSSQEAKQPYGDENSETGEVNPAQQLDISSHKRRRDILFQLKQTGDAADDEQESIKKKAKTLLNYR